MQTYWSFPVYWKMTTQFLMERVISRKICEHGKGVKRRRLLLGESDMLVAIEEFLHINPFGSSGSKKNRIQ